MNIYKLIFLCFRDDHKLKKIYVIFDQLHKFLPHEIQSYVFRLDESIGDKILCLFLPDFHQ